MSERETMKETPEPKRFKIDDVGVDRVYLEPIVLLYSGSELAKADWMSWITPQDARKIASNLIDMAIDCEQYPNRKKG